MLLVVDVASTGLVDWRGNPYADHQPHLVRLAMAQVDPAAMTFNPNDTVVYLVRPPVRIQPDGAEIHGITDEILDGQMTGTLTGALEGLNKLLAKAQAVTGYSVDFHRRVLNRSAKWLDGEIEWPEKLCLMRLSAPVAKVRQQKNGQWAWPTLNDAAPIILQREVPFPTGNPIPDGKIRVELIADLACRLLKRDAMRMPR